MWGEWAAGIRRAGLGLAEMWLAGWAGPFGPSNFESRVSEFVRPPAPCCLLHLPASCCLLLLPLPSPHPPTPPMPTPPCHSSTLAPVPRSFLHHRISLHIIHLHLPLHCLQCCVLRFLVQFPIWVGCVLISCTRTSPSLPPRLVVRAAWRMSFIYSPAPCLSPCSPCFWTVLPSNLSPSCIIGK